MTDYVKPTGNALRLQIQSDPAPGALVNMIRNPNGDLGGWGWIAPVPGSAISSQPTPMGSSWDQVPDSTIWDDVPTDITWDTWEG